MSAVRTKTADFEVNLLPVISILAVCICFLLLTAVWVHIGTLDTAQAIGSESTAGANNPPSIAIQLDKDKSLDIQLKDVKTSHRHFVIKAVQGKADWARVDRFFEQIHKKFPEIKTSIILTRPQVSYGHTIKVVDALKKVEITDVGISPM